ncbi:MerR family transcriptional regulator [Nocardia sp. NPDC059180]|uniref:DNA polymerase III subunit beta family protein n=1 Tax=Nocardia sp. NPDC059180 TaxID=3346761 RepID=UPI0036A29570
MTADKPLITIGVLARACGLTPSALRFYDDCGLLVPAEVDAATGYRYYTDDQRERALLIRKLRDIDIGLDTVAVILSAEPHEAARLLDEHVDAMTRRAREAATTAAAIKSELAALPRVSLPGALLAAAIRQVGSAVAADGEFRALTGIFVEAGREAVVLTATDRYRLTTRTLVPHSWSGASWSRVVDAAALTPVTSWLAEQDEAVLIPQPDAVRLSSEGTDHYCPAIDEQFPDYRALLSDLAPVRTRVVVPRHELIDAIDSGEGLLSFSIGAGEITVTEGGSVPTQGRVAAGNAGSTTSTGPDASARDRATGTTIPATVTGAVTVLAFARATLRPAITTAVGPDIMLDIAAPDLPVVIRSATDGDLTTLAMPTRLPNDSEENPA